MRVNDALSVDELPFSVKLGTVASGCSMDVGQQRGRIALS